jgi:hypothetical protein
VASRVVLSSIELVSKLVSSRDEKITADDPNLNLDMEIGLYVDKAPRTNQYTYCEWNKNRKRFSSLC